ncbi:hypothetical protein QR680_011388 [Steinernema hermaphroditum]|uniref:Uncharacterized protein n=1 Tax=Steinernema hermaphroditum TaxID=289476 RepID=A0AA39IS47_9BILA|nr:hypothetical protein QR680_011388 [Steinernema hermaphroditum]
METIRRYHNFVRDCYMTLLAMKCNVAFLPLCVKLPLDLLHPRRLRRRVDAVYAHTFTDVFIYSFATQSTVGHFGRTT